MEIKRPLLLISNDDGYQAKGIRQLVEMVSDFGDVLVCAPDSGRSGFACAFSVTTVVKGYVQQIGHLSGWLSLFYAPPALIRCGFTWL